MVVGIYFFLILMWYRVLSIDVFRYFFVKILIKISCKLYRYCFICDSLKVCLWLIK